ncbi:MAG TPA: pyridoxal-phosphate dependent enzyme [Microvirga sp.]|nr:pyridoxal-phosphate dependent enzyme [Microvirga sp.]
MIDPIFLNSPQFECEPLSVALGCNMLLKLETANPIRSFKGRGGSLLVMKHVDGSCERTRPLVSASAGNWGQALAYACRARSQPLLLFAAEGANRLKLDRMRALGADVRVTGSDFDSAKLAAERYAVDRGLRFVADGRDIEASVGAATIGIELLRHGPAPDVVLVPLGNGALLTGVGRWIKAASPRTEVIGVSAAGADAMAASWRTNEFVERVHTETIADGIAVRIPIPEALADMRGTVDDVILVDDEALISAMRLLFTLAGLVIEPAGAAGVAAVWSHGTRFNGHRVATILCGSNVLPEHARDWFTGAV